MLKHALNGSGWWRLVQVLRNWSMVSATGAALAVPAMAVGTAGTTGAATVAGATGTTETSELMDQVEHGYADSDGVKIHYATVGEGPLVVMIHGFPDFWYSWHQQMSGLKDRFQLVAIDQRGYNLSDQPAGEENYAMRYLLADVAAVIRHLGAAQATIVGHDWGGAVAWQFAFAFPDLVDKLIVLNLPHPNGLGREMRTNPEQQANSAYARAFMAGHPSDPDIFFGRPMTPENLAGWVRDDAVRAHYIEAFKRSDFAAMLAYYKQNYFRAPAEGGDGARGTEASGSSADGTSTDGGAGAGTNEAGANGAGTAGSDDSQGIASSSPSAPRLKMPVLLFHGLDDAALHSDALNHTWDWIDADTTIVTVPGAGHFVQQDAAELVTSTMRWWLLARP